MRGLYHIDKKEYFGIDYIKAFMAIIVIAIHTSPQSNIDNTLIKDSIHSLYNIAVPLFFIASGFLTWNKIHNSTTSEKRNRLKGWIRKTARIYIVWTAIYLPFTIYGFYLDDNSITKSGLIFIRNIVFVGENYMSWPLWYLLGMLVAATIIYFMVSQNFRQRTMYITAITMAIIGVSLEYCHDNGFLQIITNPYFRLFQTTRNGFFQGLPYIMIGISIANDGIIKSKKLLAGIILLGFVLQMVGYQFASFITSYALFSLIIQIDFSEREDNLYYNYRMTSTIIYLVHMLFVASITILLPIKLPNYLLFLIVVILSIITAKTIIPHKENRIVKLLFRS